MASYERINYALRPAKTIERKMLAEGFRRLTAFATLGSYRYIGFGSTYFSDFIMFHRTLNITNMLSIEKDVENKDRFDYNLPFKCVKIAYGKSSDVLPTLKWNTRTIAWFDYDGPLTSEVLADASFFAANAPSGSILVVSVNANAGDDENESTAEPSEDDSVGGTKPNSPSARTARRLERFKSKVGHAKVPTDVTPKDMRQWLFAGVCKRIVANEINETIRARNGILEDQDRRCSQSAVLSIPKVRNRIFARRCLTRFHSCALTVMPTRSTSRTSRIARFVTSRSKCLAPKGQPSRPQVCPPKTPTSTLAYTDTSRRLPRPTSDRLAA